MILKKKKDQNQKVKSELSEYHFNNDKIIHGNPPPFTRYYNATI